MIDGQAFPLTEDEAREHGTHELRTVLVDGQARIYSADNRWLHPDRVPTRVLRGDPTLPLPGEFWRDYIRQALERDVATRGTTNEEEREDLAITRNIRNLPAPEVPARPATLEEMPPAARKLGHAASAAGFTMHATYARGPRVGQHWKHVETVDSVMIRGQHRDGRWFAAVWNYQTKTEGGVEKKTWAGRAFFILKDGETTSCGIRAVEAYCQ